MPKVKNKELLDRLEDEDIRILYCLFKRLYRGDFEDKGMVEIRRFFKNLSRRHFFQFIHFVMGWGRVPEVNPRDLLDNFSVLKAALDRYKPKFTERVVVRHNTLGELEASIHALNRFWRYVRNDFDYAIPSSNNIANHVIDDFGKAFGAAEEVSLSKRHTLNRRHNWGEPAMYFYNQARNLRFVVMDHLRILVTVEVPNYER